MMVAPVLQCAAGAAAARNRSGGAPVQAGNRWCRRLLAGQTVASHDLSVVGQADSAIPLRTPGRLFNIAHQRSRFFMPASSSQALR